MPHIRRLALVVVAMSLLTGCASGGGGGAETGATKGSRDLIVSAELEERQFANLRQAIQLLRPTWLQRKGYSRAVRFYIDNVPAFQGLGSIPIGQVVEVRHLDAREATLRWGTGHTGGVIEVITKGRRN